MNKRINQEGLALLKKFEGFSSVAYKDVAGIWTIGYGFIKGVKAGDTITKEDAEKRLKVELISFEACINNNVFRDLTDNEFSALVCLAYNIGCKNFIGSTLCDMLNKQVNGFDCSLQFLKWNKARINGELKEVRGLTNRREMERELFLKA